MTRKIKNERVVALIEVGGSHDECVLTQMRALDSRGCHILLITNPEIIERNSTLKELAGEVLLIGRDEIKNKKWKSLRILRQFLKQHAPEKVILNTAQGSFIRDLILSSLIPFQPRTEWIGILHTTLKLRGSFTQKLINLGVKKYLLLSKDLLASVQSKGLELDYFYPLTFPAFNATATPTNRTRIAIIGGVERRRKDLDAFLLMLKSCKELPLEFVFLGKSEPEKLEVIELKKFILEENIEDLVVLFDEFVPQETVDAYLKTSAVILPLIHPDTPSAKEYFKNQIPGSMIMAFSYKIPLLIHEAYKDWSELQGSALYYNLGNFSQILNELIERKDEFQRIMKNTKDFDQAYQQERFLTFVGL